MAKSARLLATALIFGGFIGCDMTEFAANSTTNVMKKATEAFNREHDIWLAREAATGQLKFAEGVHYATPENGELMVIIAKNYALYGFAFLKFELEGLSWGTEEYEALKTRTEDFFKRARRYAVQRMALDFEDFRAAVYAPGDRFQQILAEADPEEHLPALYWLANSWGNLINLNTDDPDLLADIPRVKAIMGWVRDHQPGFENGGPLLFFGLMGTAIPAALGGQPEEAKKAFLDAIESTEGKYLMAKALYARHYMKAVNDRAGYERLLNEVLDARDDLYPEQRLANELAKQRARRWLGQADDFFD